MTSLELPLLSKLELLELRDTTSRSVGLIVSAIRPT
jgi:hypothetical protein